MDMLKIIKNCVFLKENTSFQMYCEVWNRLGIYRMDRFRLIYEFWSMFQIIKKCVFLKENTSFVEWCVLLVY